MSISQMIKHMFGGGENLNIEEFYHYRFQINNGNKIKRYISMIKYDRIMRRFGCSIPASTAIGENITFPHFNGIFISYKAHIGDNCVIYQQVTIGSNTLPDSKNTGAPIIGDNVFIGAGAKIIGGVRVGDNVRIGANCIVCEDVPANSTVVLGKPIIIEHDKPRDNHFRKW